MSRAQEIFLKTAALGLPRKRILTDLVIDEISAVDSPANEHCRITIVKRAEPEKFFDDHMKQLLHESVEHLKKMREPIKEEHMDFNKRVSEIQASEKVSRTEAMSKAADRFPAEFSSYQEAGKKASQAALEKAAPSASSKFNSMVDEIVKREGVSRSIGMQRAADRHPRELEEFRYA